MKQVILTRGLPASGKTTWAESYVHKHTNFRNVNRDDLRKMLYGANYKFTKERERTVTELQFQMAETFLKDGLSVIVSDTNLNDKTVDKWQSFCDTHHVEMSFKNFLDVSVKECIDRDKKRPNSVGESVIKRMHRQYLAKKITPYRGNEDLPDAVIFDIDGTLAIMRGRGPYDWDKVKNDALNYDVFELYQMYRDKGYKIVIMSGRDGVCEQLTREWLEENEITFDAFFIREEGNTEKDAIIKARLFDNCVAPSYNVRLVVDDRNQVVDMWRDKGLTCFQVADGDF